MWSLITRSICWIFLNFWCWRRCHWANWYACGLWTFQLDGTKFRIGSEQFTFTLKRENRENVWMHQSIEMWVEVAATILSTHSTQLFRIQIQPFQQRIRRKSLGIQHRFYIHSEWLIGLGQDKWITASVADLQVFYLEKHSNILHVTSNFWVLMMMHNIIEKVRHFIAYVCNSFLIGSIKFIATNMYIDLFIVSTGSVHCVQ